ncbi:MAG: hypothetical protein V3V61_01280 [Gammaproteobacteria bacterium]
MATILETFITKFKFESDRKGVQEVTSSLNSIKSELIKIGASIFAIISGGAIFGRLAESVDEMGKFSDSVGISVEQLQELEFAAKRTGVPINSLRMSLLGLNKVVGESARGYGIYGQVLARFGIRIRDSNGKILDTFKLMTELNRVFSGLTTAQQFDLAQNIGLSPALVRLLKKTPKDFDALIKKSKEFGTFTAVSAEKAAKFEDALTDLRTSFFELGVGLGTTVFPILTKVSNAFTELGEIMHKDSGLIKAVSVAIGLLSAAFLLLRSRAILAWAAAFAPIVGIVAGVTALVLAIQDIWTGIEGGDSVILGFLEKSKLIMAAWEGIKIAVDKIISGIGKVISFTGSIGKSIEGKLFGGLRSPSVITSPFVAAGGGSPSSDRTFNLSVGGITIHTNNGDADKIGKAVTDGLRNQLKSSVNFLDSDIRL